MEILTDKVQEAAVRVLVADDDALNLEFLRQLLSAHGYQVDLAADGEVAMQYLLRPRGPQIALLDWEMPHLNGLDLCRKIRQEITDRYVHVLMISGVHPDEHRIQALEAGADDFLPKPYHPDILLARLGVASRIVERQPGFSVRLLHALREAEASGGGDVAVREGNTVGYITFCQGKVSWAYVSQDTATFFEQLGEELKMQADSVDTVLESCRERGTDFYHELVERGYTSERDLRRAIEAWLRRKLEQIARLSQADVMFLPADRAEEPIYTFPLESVLPHQLRTGLPAAPLPKTTTPKSSAKPVKGGEWDRVFVPVSESESQIYVRVLFAMMQMPGSLGAALLDMRQNRSYGHRGLLPQASVVLNELLLLRSLHRPGLPLDMCVNQGGIFHILVAPPFETSLVLALVLDSDKGNFQTTRTRLCQLANDLSVLGDSSEHLTPIKIT